MHNLGTDCVPYQVRFGMYWYHRRRARDSGLGAGEAMLLALWTDRLLRNSKAQLGTFNCRASLPPSLALYNKDPFVFWAKTPRTAVLC